MNKRAIVIVLLVLVAVLAVMVGCKKAKPTPTPSSEVMESKPVATGTFTLVPATPTAEAEATVKVQTPTSTPAGLPQPILLNPPDLTAGTAIDLEWAWKDALAEGHCFEVQIWPDEPEAQPKAYGWYRDAYLRVTAANLVPGRYWWRVIVVGACKQDHGEELSSYSEEHRFIIVWPSLRPQLVLPWPTRPTATFTPTPRPTRTPYRSPTPPWYTPGPTNMSSP